MAETEVFFNPRCSKCRSVHGLLEDRGLDPEYVNYLERTPSREQLERVMEMLGTDDPRDMMRRNEAKYRELDLASAHRERLLEAMVAEL